MLDRFTQEGLDTSTKTVDILAAAIFARREELRKVLTAQVLERTADKTLIDYNFNVELVMSSSSSQKVNSPLMTVELLLKVNQDELG